MITQAEIDATAARVREMGVPDWLNRWLTMTPKKYAANEAAKSTIAKQQEGFHMATIGKKEQALREQRKGDTMTTAEASKVTLTSMAKAIDDSKRVDNQPAPPAKPKEKTVKTKQTKKPAAARTPVKGKTTPVKTTKPAKTDGVALRPDGLRVGSGMATLVDTVCRPKGATNEELRNAVGWKQCLPMMHKACEKAGVKVRVEKKKGEPARYFGTPAKKAAAA